MDPRTFLPPRPVPTARAPKPGDAAPALPVAIAPDTPAIVAFLRHTGCPFAEATMRTLRDAATASADIAWIAISHAPPKATERWCRAIGGSGGVRVVSDPSRRAYAEWGLGRTTLAHFLGRRSLTEVARLARHGIRNRHPHGSRWQSAGTFALDLEATVRWRHLPEHAGDVPDLDAAVHAIRCARPISKPTATSTTGDARCPKTYGRRRTCSGRGERIVFEPYTRDMLERTHRLMEAWGLFDQDTATRPDYDSAVLA